MPGHGHVLYECLFGRMQQVAVSGGSLSTTTMLLGFDLMSSQGSGQPAQIAAIKVGRTYHEG